MNWVHRHLLGIRDLNACEISYLLDKADDYRDFLDLTPKRKPILEGYCQLNLFLEASTRTRVSFEMAGKLLGMEVVNFSTNASSLRKGESFRDTVRTLARMKADVFVIRHQSSGVPEYLSRFIPCHVINAGDGLREHPTQALLDLLTIRRSFGHFNGLTVAVIGDVLHSRVARSLITGLVTMGSRVLVSGPPTLAPPTAASLGAEVVFPVEEAIAQAQVVYLLRIQRERQDAGFFPTVKEYSRFFGLHALVAKEGEKRVIMHPGPVNRGVEIDSTLVESEASLIEEQVTCGLAVRMAVLETLVLEGRAA